jgi:hypothetical protein
MCFRFSYATDGEEFLGACFYPTRTGSEVSPSLPATESPQTANIRNLRQFFRAYSERRCPDTLLLLAEHASVSDCGHREEREIVVHRQATGLSLA